MKGKWVQLHDANWKVPYLGGWCEGYVAMAWGYGKFFKDKRGNIAGTTPNGKGKTGYPSAIAHWKAKKGNHTGQPPKGITVPVFFSLGSTPYGHAAIRLDDLYVASSTLPGYHSKGYLHKNIKDLIVMYGKYNNGCKYLGWSEYVSGVRVVKWVEDKPKSKPKPPVVVKSTPKPVVTPPKPTPNPTPPPEAHTEAPVQSEPVSIPIATPVDEVKNNGGNTMSVSLPTKNQLLKVVKVAAWACASALVSLGLTFVAGHPEAFGLFTPAVNAVLVGLKQFFTQE